MRFRHPCALHENRHHWNAAAQGSLDFEPHEVLRLIESARPVLVEQRCPAWTYYDEHCCSLFERHRQYFNEVSAGLYGIDIDKYPLSTKPPIQVIGEATGIAGRILPSVADEDSL